LLQKAVNAAVKNRGTIATIKQITEEQTAKQIENPRRIFSPTLEGMKIAKKAGTTAIRVETAPEKQQFLNNAAAATTASYSDPPDPTILFAVKLPPSPNRIIDKTMRMIFTMNNIRSAVVQSTHGFLSPIFEILLLIK